VNLNPCAGVLYSLTHPAAAELLAVSLWSLRKHYRGEVVCKVAKPAEELAQRIADDRRLNLQLDTIECFDEHSRHDHRHNKTLAWMQTPFVRTVYLDADTIIQKPIDDLLNCEGFGVTAVGIGNLFEGHDQAERLWREIVNFQRAGPGGMKYCRELQEANPPVINSGVLSFGWPIHQHIIERSHDLICIARATDRRVTDETIVQLLMPRIGDLWIYPPEYNWTLLAGGLHEDQRIVHLAAAAWKNRTQGKAIFAPVLQQAWDDNAGNLQDWIGQGDNKVKGLLTKKRDGGEQ
jgi:hypothetical protein